MQVRFFPLYMWKGLGLTPLPVCLVLVAAQLGGAVWTMLAQRLSLCIGRIQVVILVKSAAVLCLLAIALLPSRYECPASILPLYLMRTWLMNAPLALSKSVMADYVPKKHRAKWASLESVNTTSWAGSALLGGLLSDAFGYRHTFLITASLQALGVLMYGPLVPLVVRERRPERRTEQQRGPKVAAPIAASSDPALVAHAEAGSMSEPLLSRPGAE